MYGYVVAADAFGGGYVIPLEEAFRNIKATLGCQSVDLAATSRTASIKGPSQRFVCNQPFFDWNRPNTIVKSQDKSWIQPFESRTPNALLDAFLDVPAYSPRSRYQLDTFRAIGLGTALDNLKAGRFGRSTLWLHDFDGSQGRSYNGVMSTERANIALQRKVCRCRVIFPAY